MGHSPPAGFDPTALAKRGIVYNCGASSQPFSILRRFVLRQRFRQSRSSSILALYPADGIPDQGWRIFQLELLLNVQTVDFDGLHADMEELRDLTGAFALPDELQDFEFAVGESLDGRMGCFGAAA